ncbi:hypothetical protein Vretimale_14509 [Volvox reticuliferus]|uniref:Uncharacterized protein n=1 Tax=Volvox reticuliferus TaxID=1737510 RepID=A0A8J4GMA6_9CHLO|nr:hypothetical protein Vretimale_14509 [Volvox reticuliferus]
MSYNAATGELSPLPDGAGGLESVEALQARLNALREEVAVQQQQEALLENQVQAELQAHQQNRGAALHQVQEAERQVKLSREAVAAATAARAQQAQAVAQAKAATQHSKAQHQNGKPPARGAGGAGPKPPARTGAGRGGAAAAAAAAGESGATAGKWPGLRKEKKIPAGEHITIMCRIHHHSAASAGHLLFGWACLVFAYRTTTHTHACWLPF